MNKSNFILEYIFIRVRLVVPFFILIGFIIAPVSVANAQDTREIMRLGRGTANSLDWRPDGEVLAVGGGTGIWLYDENFEELAHFEGSSVYPVRWSPSGDRLAFADESGVHIWSIGEDGKSGEALLTFEGTDVFTVTWKPDGTQIAVGTYGDGIRIVDVQTGDVQIHLQDAGWEAAWSPDGSKLAAPSADNYSMNIWDVTSGEKIQTLAGVDADLWWTSVAWSPDGEKIAGVTSLPASLHIWDVASGEVVNTPDTLDENHDMRQVVWDRSSNRLVTLRNSVSPPASSDITLWNASTWQVEKSDGTWSGIREVTFHPLGKHLTSLAGDSTITNWELPRVAIMDAYRLHYPAQRLIAWSPDNDQIATVVSDGEGYPVLIWKLSDNNRQQPYQTILGDVVQGLSWTYVTSLTWTDRNELVTTSENEPVNYIFRNVERWNTQTGQSEEVIFHSEYACGVYGWNLDFSIVACTNYGGTAIEVAQISTDSILFQIPIDDFVSHIQWSPDGTQLAIISRDFAAKTSSLEVWNVQSQILNYKLDFSNMAYQVHWRPDSEKMALLFYENRSYKTSIVNAIDGKTDFEVEGVVYWSPDSRLLAVFEESQIQFYEAATGDLVQSVEVKGVSALGWSPDGTMLALSMDDGTIRIWGVTDIQ
jgi:WD40 repeat protein